MTTALPQLRTARLLIRSVVAGDEAACRRTLAPDDEASFLRWMAWIETNHVVLADLLQPPYGERAIEVAATGEVVGLVGLVPMLAPFRQLEEEGGDVPFTCEVGLYWALDPAHRGRGYATEAATALASAALERMRLQRLVAATEESNIASQAVMRRMGMRLLRNRSAELSWFQVVGLLEP